MNRSQRISKAARLLWVLVPEPVQPPSKPQKSWATLKQGDRVRMPNNKEGTIEQATNQGVEIRLDSGLMATWTDRDWKGKLTKLRKSRVKISSESDS